MSALLEPEVAALMADGARPRRLAQSPRPARARRMNAGEHVADLFVQTLANLRRNKLRSFLTLFGIAWGIASLVLMSALSDGFRQGQRKNMSQIGDNIVFVWGGSPRARRAGSAPGAA